MIIFDVSELLKLGQEYSETARGLADEVRPPIAKAALNVKNAMRDDLAASEHFKQVARAVTYDTRAGIGWAEALVGPVTAGATVGDLAHFAYFGGAHGGGNTVRDPIDAAKDEEPNLEAALAAVVDGLLG